MIGRGSDVTDSVLFEEIFKLSADEVVAIVHDYNFWQPFVAKVILNFSMVALEVDVFIGNTSIHFE